MNDETTNSRELLDELQALASVSRTLEPGASQREELLELAAAVSEDFLARLPQWPVYNAPDPGLRSARWMDPDEEPLAAAELLPLLDRHVASDGLQEGSARFFGFIPGGGLYASAVADYFAAVINRYTGVEFAAPAAARLERRLIAWLCRETGFPETAGGDLTSGGSIANLSAIVAAREAHGIRARDVERSVVYVSPVTHHSSIKALGIAGLSEIVLRVIDVDDRFRMDARVLESRIAEDRELGLRPWLIICSAGATDTGSVDPLSRLADIARDEQLWLHVDAAYGGAFALCEDGRRRLAGMERADSVTLDPHKGLFLPFGSGAVLVRERRHLFAANHARGAYMQDLGDEASIDSASACDFSPELTRPFRGLRLWLPLRLYGVSAFRAALAEKLLLASYAYQGIQALDDVEMGPAPDLSIFWFRVLPPGEEPNAFNRRLANAIRDDGRIYLSTTTLNGRFVLRFAVLGYNTHREDVDLAIGVIDELVGQLRESPA